MTQQEVADKLNVSNKTVSKWERDEGCPEIMMLPALAELYSVTVDEILRGERIIRAESEERKNEKSEERLKYLSEKATVRFTNCSIISVVLGAVAAVLSYTVSGIVSYNYIWLAYMLILALVAASVIVILVAFNSFSAGIKSLCGLAKEDFEDAMGKCIKYMATVTFLTVVSVSGLIMCIVVDVPDFIFIILPVTALWGFAAAYYVRYLLYKKYGVEEKGISAAQKLYRKKHIRVTAVILAVIVLASFVLPFISVFVESSVHSIYSFPDGVGYQYETDEEAQREYHKLKGYVTGERSLYKIISEDYSEETGEYIIYAEPLQEYFEQARGGFNKIRTEFSEEETFRFKSFEESEGFRAENAFDDELEYLAGQRNIIFDDETLSVSYQSQNDNFLSGVADIMPVFLLISMGGIGITLPVSFLVYCRNKKKIL